MCISTRDSWFNQRIDTEFDNRRESDYHHYMYLGRVGPISMAIGFSQKNKKKNGHVSGTGSDLISEIDSHYNMISQRR